MDGKGDRAPATGTKRWHLPADGQDPGRIRLRAGPFGTTQPAPMLRARIALLLVLVAAAAIRAPGLALYPLEQDELYTVAEATDLFATNLQPGIDARPLYFLMQHALLEVVPQTPASLRLPSLVFGLFGIWLTWMLGVRVFGTTAGLVGALLVAISPWHLHASGMARYWSLLYALSAAFLLLFLRASTSDRPRHHLAVLVPLSLGAATHPTFLFSCVGVALAPSLVPPNGAPGWRWPSRNAWTFLWGPFFLLLAAGLAALALTGNEAAVRNWSGRGWLASLRLVPGVIEWTTPTLAVAAALGAGLSLVAPSRPGERRWGAVAVLGSASTLALLCAASLVTDVYVDYAIAMLPLVFVSCGALVHRVSERVAHPSPAVGWIGAAILAAGVLPATVSHLSNGTRFDYRPAYRHILASAPEVTVLAWPLVVQRYYAPTLTAHYLRPDPPRLDSLLAREGDLWVVASIRRLGMVDDDSGRGREWLGRRCTLELAHERPRLDYRMYRVEVYRCRRDAHAGAPRAGSPPVAGAPHLERPRDD